MTANRVGLTREAQTLSLLERAWKAGFDVLMLTVDTWQLGWRPTDINIANYVSVPFLLHTANA
jgi:isopentenyl diphosphate isomerase/L-lactate dehydrogenase-like FMN-dependent dehydrogenase